MPLSPGKLPVRIIDRLLHQYYPAKTGSRVIIGPKVGQDCAVIELADRYLISKTDPVTFATDEIGYYVVHINANDIATSGATPKWFQNTVLLPEKSADEALCDKIFGDIARECDILGIEVVGGHTEVTIGLDRPIIVGNMLGEVEKGRLVTSMGGKPGDALILTKGIVLEGTAIIAREKEKDLLKKGMSQALIEQGKQYLHNPGISIVKEAQLLHSNFTVHAMHDPTEGGLAMGLVELASNSNCGLSVDYQKIPFIDGSREFCKAYGLDPLRTIASGALLVAVPPDEVESLIKYMKKQGICVACIGYLTDVPDQYSIIMPSGKKEALVYSEIDEITKIF